MVIDHLDPAEGGGIAGEHIFCSDNIAKVGFGSLRPGSGITSPFPGIFKIICCNGTTILEFNILFQRKSIHGAVAADFPALGDIRRRLEVVIQCDQSAEDLQNKFIRRGITGNCGVKRERVSAVQTQHTAAGRCSSGSSCCRSSIFTRLTPAENQRDY